MTRCSFAPAIAGDLGKMDTFVKLSELDDETVPEVNAFIDESCGNGVVPLVLFPRIRTHNAVARLLQALQRNSCWSCSVVPWNKSERPGAKQVGLYYEAHGRRSSAIASRGTVTEMGLASLAERI